MEVGEYRITMTGLPEGFYLKEARLNGRDVLTTSSDDFSEGGNLEVVVSPNAGDLEGQVVDAEGRPAVAVEAVLIPEALRRHPERYEHVITDAEGRFRIATVPPGDYKVFAWERVEDYAYFDEYALMPFENLGVPVRVAESSSVTVEVELIPGEITP
jgi:hypothetical protein